MQKNIKVPNLQETQKKEKEQVRKYLGIQPKDFLLSNYNLKVETDKDGDFLIKVIGEKEGRQIGTIIHIKKNTHYSLITHSIRECFFSIFRNEIDKKIKENKIS